MKDNMRKPGLASMGKDQWDSHSCLFRSLVENGTEGVTLLDSSANVLSFRIPASTQILGYAPEEVLRRSVFARMHPEDVPEIKRQFAKVVQELGSSGMIEFRYQHKDGSWRWLEGTYHNLLAEPSVRAIAVYYRDITEWKRIMESLRNSQALYLSLVEALPQNIFRKDSQGRFTFVNQRFCELLGKSSAEVVGKTDADFYPAGLAEKYREDDQAVILSGAVHENLEEHQTPRGEQLFVHVVKAPVHDAEGKVIGIQGIFWDETARRQAEERIREQAELLDKVQEAISVQDLGGRILYWNRGAAQLYGWTPQEILGRTVNGLLNQVGNHNLAEARQRTLTTGSWVGELERFTKAGRTITVQSRWTLMQEASGKPRSILCVDADITEQKTLEAEFLRAQRLEGIGTLSSGIAHDLNNILAPILMSAETLKEKPLDAETKETLTTIKNCAQRGAEIVKQLLAFARGMGGERTLMQPRHLLTELSKMIRETFPKSIVIQSNAVRDLWQVAANPTELHQVLLNLCVNARDAMPEGGHLTLSAENVQLDDLSARALPPATPGAYVLLSVADTGQGIRPEIIDRIFDPFFTTKDQGKGTGLGLSTVLGIVRSHGGCVRVDSKLNKGSIFKVYLPAQPGTTPPSEALEPKDMPRGNGELILLVDDEVSILTVTQRVLQRYGYHVLTAGDGAEALALFAQRQAEVQLVLTDVLMPVMDGITLIRSLKRLDPRVAIIVATGLGSANRTEELKSSGIKTCLAKPYATDKLLMAIRDNLPKVT